MAWNLNNYSNEYELFNSQTEEVIDMFGLVISYVKAQGVNLDNIFGEYSHKKINQDSSFQVSVLPENSEEFEQLGNTFSKFGFVHTETFNCYISAREVEKLGYTDFKNEAVGDIIVTPNDKFFEVTFVEHEVQGTNNMFPYTNRKNVYMIKAKKWSYNGDDKEAPITGIDAEGNETIEDRIEQFNFTSLDEIFNNTEPIEQPISDITDDLVVIQPDNERVTAQEESATTQKINVIKGDAFGEWD